MIEQTISKLAALPFYIVRIVRFGGENPTTSTLSYFSISKDTISRDPRSLSQLLSQFLTSQRRGETFSKTSDPCSVQFSWNDLINFLCSALTLITLATFHTNWKILLPLLFYASGNIHSLISLHLCLGKHRRKTSGVATSRLRVLNLLDGTLRHVLNNHK